MAMGSWFVCWIGVQRYELSSCYMACYGLELDYSKIRRIIPSAELARIVWGTMGRRSQGYHEIRLGGM